MPHSDLLSYALIVGVIAAFVISFTIWSKRKPGSRKPEQAIFLSVALFGAGALCWMSTALYFSQRETGIPVMSFEIKRLLSVAGVSLLFGAAFRASRIKEREEKKAQQVGTDNSGATPRLV
jgi:hypothetical protein